MSKLIVEVCKIEKIEKHPNADRLSIATIKGWHCIVGLDQYKVGDLVVFCPPDSMIPDDIIEQYNLEYLKKGKRVRTVKLRGFISQGLVLDIPLPMGSSWKEGLDVAIMMGITKYEPPAPKYQQFKGQKKSSKKKRNPLFDKYTDIENIKNYNRIFQEGDEVIITEKIHGTNFRAGRLPISPGYGWIDKIKYFIDKFLLNKKYEFVYGSHNVQITYHANRNCFYGDDVYGKIANRYKLAEIIPKDYIIYGEIYGKGIQELTYGVEGLEVVFFDVKYKGKYLSYNEFWAFCTQFQLPMAPKLYEGPFSEKVLKECTEGDTTIYTANHIREGCVVKPAKEENNNRIGRKILKSINPEYLVNKKRTESH